MEVGVRALPFLLFCYGFILIYTIFLTAARKVSKSVEFVHRMVFWELGLQSFTMKTIQLVRIYFVARRVV